MSTSAPPTRCSTGPTTASARGTSSRREQALRAARVIETVIARVEEGMARHGMAVPGDEPPGLMEPRTADDREAPVTSGPVRGWSGPRSPRHGPARARRCAERRTRQPSLLHQPLTRRGAESTSTISARVIDGGRVVDRRWLPADAEFAGVSGLGLDHVLDDLVPVAPPPRSLAEARPARAATTSANTSHDARSNADCSCALAVVSRLLSAVAVRSGYAEVRARRTAELLDHLEVIGRSGIERHPGAVGDCGMRLGVRPAFPGRVGRLAPSGTSPASRRTARTSVEVRSRGTPRPAWGED